MNVWAEVEDYVIQLGSYEWNKEIIWEVWATIEKNRKKISLPFFNDGWISVTHYLT